MGPEDSGGNKASLKSYNAVCLNEGWFEERAPPLNVQRAAEEPRDEALGAVVHQPRPLPGHRQSAEAVGITTLRPHRAGCKLCGIGNPALVSANRRTH